MSDIAQDMAVLILDMAESPIDLDVPMALSQIAAAVAELDARLASLEFQLIME